MEVCLLIGFNWKHNMLLITLVLITCLLVSSVSAEEINTDVSGNLTSVDSSVDVLKEDISNNSDILSSGSSFADLNNEIKNAADGGSISLNQNYTYDSSSDSKFVNGIVINKKLTINGNGHTIDAGNSARVFNITASGVVLNDVIIKNAQINNTIDYSNSVYKENMNITLFAVMLNTRAIPLASIVLPLPFIVNSLLITIPLIKLESFEES